MVKSSSRTASERSCKPLVPAQRTRTCLPTRWIEATVLLAVFLNFVFGHPGPSADKFSLSALHSDGTVGGIANSSFTVGAPTAQSLQDVYDAVGNLIQRTNSNGVVQILTWDPFNRLIKVSSRDSNKNGYDWTAAYDGLGRRLSTAQQTITNNAVQGAPFTTQSTFDPDVEFLEVGLQVSDGTSTKQWWKVYGPDLNGSYGSLQGIGGLVDIINQGTGTNTPVINDSFGNVIGSVGQDGGVHWNATRAGGYGPLPTSLCVPLAVSDDSLVAASVWHGKRLDPTGFYNLGARNYDPIAGKFISAEPLGHASSLSLYDYCHGDPVNGLDPDGRLEKSVSNGFQDGVNFSNGYPVTHQLNVSSDPTLLLSQAIAAVTGVVTNTALQIAGSLSYVIQEATGVDAQGQVFVSMGLDIPADASLLATGLKLSLAELNAAEEGAGLANAAKLGQAGEDAVGITAPKVRIEIPGSGQIRIPDALTNTTLTEVKNVGSLSYTQQLRDFTTYCQANGLSFELYVRPSTQLSGPLQQAIANGQITLKFIPGAQ